MTHVVIIHGTGGSPDGNWFPWLATELRKKGYDVDVPRFPTPADQNLATWLEVFRKEIGFLAKDTVLIGHSVGVGFVLNLLQRSRISIKGTFLIAGFTGRLGLPEFDVLNRSFVSGPFEWTKIKNNAGLLRLLNGDDDPYVPLVKGQDLARRLGTELIVVHQGGHLNAESGFTTFPLLLDHVLGTCPP